MNSREIFTIALGLTTPLYVKGIRFESVECSPIKDLHIDIDFPRGSVFRGMMEANVRLMIQSNESDNI